MKKMIFSLIILSSLRTFAGGNLQLNGTVRNFDTKTVDIDDGKKIYSIDRTKLMQKVQMKAGAKVQLFVSLDAIEKVRKK
jgi:hypothetical protein